MTDAGLQTLKFFSKLKRLDLSGTAVSDQGVNLLHGLPLTHLALGPSITDKSAVALAGIPSLEQLDLGQTKMGDETAPALTRLRRLHTLFAPPLLTNDGARALAGIQTLRRLDLTGSPLDDQGLQPIAELKGLEELALSRTGITDKGLAVLPVLAHLRYLEISGTAVTPNGLSQLQGAPALEVISLSSKTKLQMKDLEPLGALPKLRLLIVNGVPMDPELIRFLRKRAPSLHSWRWLDRWIPEAQAAGIGEGELERVLEVASASPQMLHDRSAPMRFEGLRRIHQAESELENIIPAVSAPAIDVQEDTEKNFLGEFTVNSTAPKKKSTR